MHYKAQETLFFYIIAFIFVLVLFFGLIGVIHLWLLGRAKREDTEVSASKFIAALLKTSLFQTQILEYSILAWWAHLFISFGFLALLMLTAFHFALMWLVPSSSDIFHYFTSGKGNLILAVWGDFWGLALLVGVILAMFRRYILRPKQLNTISDDSIAILFLLVVTVSGFLCEAVRLAARPQAADFAYSFAVNWAASLLEPYKLSESIVELFFWLHGAISFLFLAYIPFSKYRHIFTSPFVYALITSNSQYTKDGRLERNCHGELQEV